MGDDAKQKSEISNPHPRLPTRYSLLATRYSRLPTPDSRAPLIRNWTKPLLVNCELSTVN